MKILVDCDGYAKRSIIEKLASKYKIELHYFFDTCHNITSDYAILHQVDKGNDSVDFYLVNMVEKGDLVITNDAGLAAMSLARKASCINEFGVIYNEYNINAILAKRYIRKIERLKGNKPKMISSDLKLDKGNFINKLENIIKKHKENN